MYEQGECNGKQDTFEWKIFRQFHGEIFSPVSTCVSLPPLESVTITLHGKLSYSVAIQISYFTSSPTGVLVTYLVLSVPNGTVISRSLGEMLKLYASRLLPSVMLNLYSL